MHKKKDKRLFLIADVFWLGIWSIKINEKKTEPLIVKCVIEIQTVFFLFICILSFCSLPYSHGPYEFCRTLMRVHGKTNKTFSFSVRSFWEHESNWLSHDSVLLGVIIIFHIPTVAWHLIPYPYEHAQAGLVPSSDAVKSINWPITQSSHLFAQWPPSTGCAMVGPLSKGAHKRRKKRQNKAIYVTSSCCRFYPAS